MLLEQVMSRLPRSLATGSAVGLFGGGLLFFCLGQLPHTTLAFVGPIGTPTRTKHSQQQQIQHGLRLAPLSAPSNVGLSAVLTPRQREEREMEEVETLVTHTQYAKKLAAKVLEKAPEPQRETLRPKLDRLVRKAGVAVTQRELMSAVERMAKLIDHKVFFANGDLEIVPSILEAEQKEIDTMRQLMDAGNYSAALQVYQGRYKRFAYNPPPPEQTAMAFEALFRRNSVNQTVNLYNYWYNAKDQHSSMLDADCLYWTIRSLCSVGRLDMALDVFRSHPRFNVLPNRKTLDLLLSEAVNRELYELGSELLEASDLGGFRIDPQLVYVLIEKLLDMQLLDHADRAVHVLLRRRLPIDPKVGTYFKNFVVKNGRLHLAYLHLTDRRLTHSAFRASANGYNMLLWRLCRLWLRMRDSALSDSSSNGNSGSASSTQATKQELRAITLRISRVVATMSRFGYKVTPQSGAMLQDVAAATSEYGTFRVLENELKKLEEKELDFGI